MSKQTRTRIMSEIKNMQKNPAEGIVAAPLDDNLFEWHFTISGADKTEFEGGRYHGKFILPSSYPMKAPDVIMLTKSGRFEINKKICLNFTGYHHELWQPAWTILTMLTALRAFMETPAKGVGSVNVDKSVRIKYAKKSLHYYCDKCKTKMNEIVFHKIKKNDNDKQNQDNNDKDNNNDNDTQNDDISDKSSNSGDGVELNDNNNINDETNENIADNINDIDNINNTDNSDIANNNSNNLISNSNITNRKDRLLDNFTVLLVLIIIGILIKKFAIKFLDKL